MIYTIDKPQDFAGDRVDSAASMTLGYRVDAFWDLYQAPDEAPANDRITHGPFAKLTVDLSGGN